MRRLHAGQGVDIDEEAPIRRLVGDELAQVGTALTAVQRAALKAASERAELLSGISGVYVSLARRSQVLLHRQLDLIDGIRQRVQDPAELRELYRVDYLATRMRRHSESLLILSGIAPAAAGGTRSRYRPVRGQPAARAAGTARGAAAIPQRRGHRRRADTRGADTGRHAVRGAGAR